MTGRWRHRVRVLGAIAVLVVTTLTRRLAGPRTMRWLLGRPRPATHEDRGRLEPPDPEVRAIVIAVLAASRRLPALSCLDRALAGRLLLRARGRSSSVVIGIPVVDRSLPTHAWLVDDTGCACLGGAEASGYAPVTVFGG